MLHGEKSEMVKCPGYLGGRLMLDPLDGKCGKMPPMPGGGGGGTGTAEID